MTDTAAIACRQCGAKMVYDPAAGVLQCAHCGATAAIASDAAPAEELDYRAHLNAAAAGNETVEAATVRCSGCGAVVTLAEQVTADLCPFCGTAIASAHEQTRRLRPRSLLPFAVSRQVAVKAFADWVAARWFAPNAFKAFARGERGGLSGVYVPYWTYDASTASSYTGQRGDDYYTTEHYTTTVNGKRVTRTRQVRHTRWTHVSGTVALAFDDVLVLASTSLPKTHAVRLEPWDLQNLVPFDPQFLAGFRAESYGVGLEAGFEEARVIMDERIRQAINRDIGGDHQRIDEVSTRYDAVRFKHLLLPVWISACRFRNKVYRFLVNARTGEVQGERPWSAWKIAGAVLAGLAVVLVIAAIVVQA